MEKKLVNKKLYPKAYTSTTNVLNLKGDIRTTKQIIAKIKKSIQFLKREIELWSVSPRQSGDTRSALIALQNALGIQEHTLKIYQKVLKGYQDKSIQRMRQFMHDNLNLYGDPIKLETKHRLIKAERP